MKGSRVRIWGNFPVYIFKIMLRCVCVSYFTRVDTYVSYDGLHVIRVLTCDVLQLCDNVCFLYSAENSKAVKQSAVRPHLSMTSLKPCFCCRLILSIIMRYFFIPPYGSMVVFSLLCLCLFFYRQHCAKHKPPVFNLLRG